MAGFRWLKAGAPSPICVVHYANHDAIGPDARAELVDDLLPEAVEPLGVVFVVGIPGDDRLVVESSAGST